MSETITIRRPDDWHVHLRDGAMLEAVAPYTARQFARAIIMPNLVAAGDDRCRGCGLSRPHRRRGGARFHAADDRLSDRRHRPRRDRARASRRRLGRRQALSRRRDHQQRLGRHRHPQHPRRARADGEDRHGPVRPRRSHRSGGRHVRPRGGVHRSRAERRGPRFPGAQDRVRAYHHARRGRIRRGFGA